MGSYRLGACRVRERVYASFYATRFGSQTASILRLLRAAPTAPRILRFEREREAMRQLAEAPHVVRLLDWGVYDQRPYLVTDDICGRSLARILAEQRERRQLCSARRACRIMLGVATGLHHAHARHVFHCALDPSKVWVDVDGRGDETGRVLGFAVPHLRGPGRITSAADFGNPAYCALAQSIGSSPRPAFDIFAWGTLLLEFLSGEAPPPIAGWGEANRPNLRTLRPNLPSDLFALIDACVTSDARQAIQSTKELLHRLESVLLQLPEPWDGSLQTGMRALPPRRASWRTSAWTIAAAALLTVGSAATFGMYTGTPPRAAATWAAASLAPLDDATLAMRDRDLRRLDESVTSSVSVSAFPAPPAPPLIPPPEFVPHADLHIDPAPVVPSPTVRKRPNETVCQRVRKRAEHARKQRDFDEVLALLRHRSCFDREQFQQLKVLSLLRLHRYKECAAAGEGTKALIVSRRVALCKSRLR